MLNFKSLYRVLAILVFSSLLSGCGATYPTPAPSLPEKPAPEIEPVLPEPAPLPPSASQTEQKITEPLPAVMPEPEDTSTVKKEVYVNYGDIEFVQHRLIVYENKYKQWLNISAAPLNNTLAEKIASQKTECLNELEAIQNGYNQLMKMMQLAESLSSGTDAAVNPKNMQQVDIAFLEGRCNELLTLGIAGLGEGRPEAESKTSFAEEEDIASYMQEGNYPKVILTYTNLIQKFPDQKPSLTTRLNYGRALQYTGQLEAAARHFKNLLASGDISIDPITIQGAIADFLLADAKVDAAKFFYNSLIQEQQSLDAEKNWAQEQLAFLNSVDPDSEDMIAYMKLLREFQSSDYRIHAPRLNRMINDFANEHAGSPIAVSALRLKTFAVNRLKSWFGSQLVKIDTLVAEKKFTEANAVLKNLSNYYLPAELQSVLQKTFYDVAQTEFQEQENQQRLKKMELSSQWEAAVNLLDSQQYESAISAFASLMGTEYEKEAEVKIIEAANQAAGEMRKEAAALFIRAGKTQDLEQKKDLLLESHRLLTDILARYPQTELLDKVRQNISILEEQIDRLDPTLLERSSQENSAETSDPSHGLGSEQTQ